MNILITGGTGLIGTAFIKKYQHDHTFTVLTRSVHKVRENKKLTAIASLSNLKHLDNFDAVINLQGEPIVGKRWSAAQKLVLQQSRWLVTEQLSTLIKQSSSPPTAFISGSAIGYYGRQTSLNIDESSPLRHQEFSHWLCKNWEQAAQNAQSHTRVCQLRTGIVLSPLGGALAQMLPSFKLGLGAVIASGQQYMPWIHVDDMVRAIEHLLHHPPLTGVFNLTAPNPVTNREFTNELAQILRRPRFLALPAPVMKIILGEAADLVIYGQHVIPTKLLDSGFNFKFEQLNSALKDLLSKQ